MIGERPFNLCHAVVSRFQYKSCWSAPSPQEDLTSRVAMATSSGYRVEMHVIGDRAVDVALNALRDAKVAAEKRPIFIHCQVCDHLYFTNNLSLRFERPFFR